MEEKKAGEIQPIRSNASVSKGDVEDIHSLKAEDEFEVFKTGIDGVQFRLVGWPKASVIFLKVIFATGVLSIPTAMYSLGAVGGAFSVIGWGLLNTCKFGVVAFDVENMTYMVADFAIVQGNFRNRHAQCHSIADMALVVGGPVLKEICGGLFIIAYVLCTGSGIIGVATALNALSEHAACTVWWAFLSAIVIIACASVRKFEKIGWL